MEYILQTKDVSRVFGRGTGAVHALQKINVKIPKGKLIVLKGRSGSGKTTLLNLLGGLDVPTDGEIYFEEKEISRLSESERTELRRKHMSYIFQSFGLIPLMTAYENIEFGMRLAGLPRKDWDLRCQEALELVGLSKRAKHRPFEMSGGEQQRCAIARALAIRPPLILADEPTAELDSNLGIRISVTFREIVMREGISIVMTTHDPAIMEVADYVFTLEDGQILESS